MPHLASHSNRPVMGDVAADVSRLPAYIKMRKLLLWRVFSTDPSWGGGYCNHLNKVFIIYRPTVVRTTGLQKMSPDITSSLMKKERKFKYYKNTEGHFPLKYIQLKLQSDIYNMASRILLKFALFQRKRI